MKDHASTILLCDDDTALLGFVTNVLEAQGYQCISVGDAPAALNQVAKNGRAISLLLTDVQLPSNSGFALGRSVRQIHPHIKVLYMTGSGIAPPVSTDEIIYKPFSTTALLERMDEMLEGSRTSREKQK